MERKLRSLDSRMEEKYKEIVRTIGNLWSNVMNKLTRLVKRSLVGLLIKITITSQQKIIFWPSRSYVHIVLLLVLRLVLLPLLIPAPEPNVPALACLERTHHTQFFRLLSNLLLTDDCLLADHFIEKLLQNSVCWPASTFLPGTTFLPPSQEIPQRDSEQFRDLFDVFPCKNLPSSMSTLATAYCFSLRVYLR